MSRSARILLADDHTLVRRGVRMILEQQPDLEVVAEAGDGAEAVELLRTTEVDLAILDVAMPRLTGLQAAREISRRKDPPRILMLSMHDNEQYFFESLRVGASGYVLKSVADRDLVDACRAALRGESFLYPGAESTLVRDYLARLSRGERLPRAVLTPREDEVVKLIAEGHSSREIARELTISVKTVERHRENVLAKLGMRDRTELTRYAIRVGLIEP
ncbi:MULTISPECIES: response regulator [unclassified Nocardioides]|uniref:response regulator n=1 Tax=unclassified Nocardioides TaxID=2615069 RepID=UPI0006F28EB8|nr:MULTISPECIES: response regulator transcription factor [unclassified Nocardioides]KQY54629.1 two-component system response regulator [Nocardioides sp. Root140]KQZ66504.1 two-component system response regulator [Nocardioides sp. Root151]KRF19727.1 two-component system response regulator [Nocardioides sp. Soil796]